MPIQRMSDLDLSGKRVLIREDLNVPVKDGKVTSEQRILAALPTIRLALEKGAAAMVTSHLGRPKEGSWTEEDSLAPVAARLSQLLGRDVPLVRDWVDGVDVKPGQLVLLENCRMYWIDREGGTADPLVLQAWAPGVPDTPEGLRQLAPFAQSAALTLADWRFERAEGNSKGRALITNVVFLFARDAGTDLAALRRECLVGDLRDFVYGKTDAGYRRGNLNKGLLERQRAEYPPTIPDGCTRHPGWCD